MTIRTPPLLAVRDLHAAYGPIEVLHGIDFEVAPGQVVAILGSNGAGKTTPSRWSPCRSVCSTASSGSSKVM